MKLIKYLKIFYNKYFNLSGHVVDFDGELPIFLASCGIAVLILTKVFNINFIQNEFKIIVVLLLTIFINFLIRMFITKICLKSIKRKESLSLYKMIRVSVNILCYICFPIPIIFYFANNFNSQLNIMFNPIFTSAITLAIMFSALYSLFAFIRLNFKKNHNEVSVTINDFDLERFYQDCISEDNSKSDTRYYIDHIFINSQGEFVVKNNDIVALQFDFTKIEGDSVKDFTLENFVPFGPINQETINKIVLFTSRPPNLKNYLHKYKFSAWNTHYDKGTLNSSCSDKYILHCNINDVDCVSIYRKRNVTKLLSNFFGKWHSANLVKKDIVDDIYKLLRSHDFFTKNILRILKNHYNANTTLITQVHQATDNKVNKTIFINGDNGIGKTTMFKKYFPDAIRISTYNEGITDDVLSIIYQNIKRHSFWGPLWTNLCSILKINVISILAFLAVVVVGLADMISTIPQDIYYGIKYDSQPNVVNIENDNKNTYNTLLNDASKTFSIINSTINIAVHNDKGDPIEFKEGEEVISVPKNSRIITPNFSINVNQQATLDKNGKICILGDAQKEEDASTSESENKCSGNEYQIIDPNTIENVNQHYLIKTGDYGVLNIINGRIKTAKNIVDIILNYGQENEKGFKFDPSKQNYYFDFSNGIITTYSSSIREILYRILGSIIVAAIVCVIVNYFRYEILLYKNGNTTNIRDLYLKFIISYLKWTQRTLIIEDLNRVAYSGDKDYAIYKWNTEINALHEIMIEDSIYAQIIVVAAKKEEDIRREFEFVDREVSSVYTVMKNVDYNIFHDDEQNKLYDKIIETNATQLQHDLNTYVETINLCLAEIGKEPIQNVNSYRELKAEIAKLI